MMRGSEVMMGGPEIALMIRSPEVVLLVEVIVVLVELEEAVLVMVDLCNIHYFNYHNY